MQSTDLLLIIKQCLGTPNYPCIVFSCHGVRIMLDCGLDLQQIVHFLPQSNTFSSIETQKTLSYCEPVKFNQPNPNSGSSLSDVFYQWGGTVLINSTIKFGTPHFELADLSTIDILLISNFTNLLSLPFILQYSNFHGKVYATEPTVQIGKQIMEELVSFVQASNIEEISHWQLSNQLSSLPIALLEQIQGCHEWKKIYNKHDVDLAISKIISLNYDQHVSIYNLFDLIPSSAGFCLGSANWIIKSHSSKIVCLGDSSALASRHPALLSMEYLKGADVLIASKLSGSTDSKPADAETVFSMFLENMGNTLSRGGNVLIPISSGGIIFDLIEVIHTFLLGKGNPSIPMYYISPQAEYLLQYANILGEWLSPTKQEKIFLPETPFQFEELMKGNQLYIFNNVDDIKMNSSSATPSSTSAYREPCIVFAGHPSLRLGPVMHFIKLWKGDAKNSIIFVENDYDHISCLAPFQSEMLMKVYYCPIETRLSVSEFNTLLKTIAPKHLVIPKEYISNKSGNNNTVQASCPVTPYSPLDIIKIPFEPKFSGAMMTRELALNLQPKTQSSSFGFVEVDAVLEVADNMYKLDVPTVHDLKILHSTKQKVLWGNVQLDVVLQALKKKGIEDYNVENSNGKIIVHINSLKATVTLVDGNHTSVDAKDYPSLLILRDILLAQLNQ